MLSRQAPFRRRAARPAARALIFAALALAAFGCGEGDDGDGGGAAATALTVTLDVDGSGGDEPQTAELACPGDPGCDVAERLTAADLGPVPPTTACTEIFGGPDVAELEGTLNGEQVEATFDRSNGCEIERFGAILPLLKELFPGYEPGSALTG